MEISENHKRPIETTFWMLEELLCSFQRWASGNEIHATLYKEHNILTDTQRLKLRDEIIVFQNLLVEVKADLQLEGFTLNLGKALQSLAGLFTENMEELKAHRLRSYGEPSPELAAYLEPKIKTFITHLHRISYIGTEALRKN